MIENTNLNPHFQTNLEYLGIFIDKERPYHEKKYTINEDTDIVLTLSQHTGCFSINETQTHAYNFFIVQDFSVKFNINDADNLPKLCLKPIIVAHKIIKCSMS